MLNRQKLLKLDEPSDDIMELNLGPQHPSTHGVLRLKLRLDGELVVSCEPVIGYLHTGVEKECETRTFLQMFTLISRLDYLSGPAEEHSFAQNIETIMGLEVPERAQTIRVILMELSRISSHLLWLGTSALELNMSSVFMYAFVEREKILDLIEGYSGARMFPNCWRIGGLNRDIPESFVKDTRKFLKELPIALKDLDNLLTENYVWCERLKGVGVVDKALAEQYMCTGPVIRASGIAYDVRKAFPYSGYENYTFDIPTHTDGDAFARYLVRLQEMRESSSIVEQGLNRLKPGPHIVDNRKVALPPRSELARSMEAVIHQFKLVSEGIHPPKAENYSCVESPRGELGYYVETDGSNKPYRVRVRSPSFAHVQLLKKIVPGLIISDVVVAIASVDPILGDVDR